MSFRGDGDDTRLPASVVLSTFAWSWKMLRHRLMAQLPEQLVKDVGYAQAEEIVCQAVLDLHASVRRPDGFGSGDGETEGGI